jgi:Voltage gated chloride channel
MAAFFTGVVRAPVTGIVLVAEMTGWSWGRVHLEPYHHANEQLDA